MGTKAILHIGSGKAGSTTIQDNLFVWRKELMDGGILVPEIDGRRVNQKEIADIFGNSGDDVQSRRLLSKILSDIRTLSPKFIIFSSEFMWINQDCAPGAKRVLSDVCDDIRVVAFLREPVGYYLSLMQQILKATDEILDPNSWTANYRENLAPWKSVFGDKLSIVPFQSPLFSKGLTEEFLRRFLGYAVDSRVKRPSERSNVSEHGEVTYIMQKYFRYCYAGEPRSFRKDADMVRGILSEISASEGLGAKPTLLPTIRRIILRNNCEDLMWLKQSEGIEFDALDYEELLGIESSSHSANWKDFDGIVGIDKERSDEIVMKSMRCLSERLSQLGPTIAELKKTRSGLTVAKAELEETRSGLDATKAELEKTRSSLDDTKAELERTRSGLAAAKAELERTRSSLDDARSDIAARRSKIAARIDRLDYELHLFLAKLSFTGKGFRSRMRVAADKRRRQCYTSEL